MRLEILIREYWGIDRVRARGLGFVDVRLRFDGGSPVLEHSIELFANRISDCNFRLRVRLVDGLVRRGTEAEGQKSQEK